MVRRVLALLACLLLPTAAWAGVPGDFFHDPHTPVGARVSLLSREPGLDVSSVAFPSLVQADRSPNNTVYGWYYRPTAPRPAPAAIVVHEWGTKGAHRARALARELARRGVAAFVVTLPYHMQRATRTGPAGKSFLTGDPEETLQHVRQAILDIRRAADWLAQQPEIDHSRLGIAGISLGAVLADLALGVDARFSAGASILGAADVARVYWRSPILWKRRREAERRGWTLERVEQAFAPADPAAYACRIRPEQVLLINARHDFVLPRRAVDALWEAYGRPQRLWLDAGHWGGLLAESQVWRRTADFLHARLNGNTGPLPLAPISVPVRLRAGVYAVDRTRPTPALSLGLLRWGAEGEASVEVLISRARPLVSLAYALGEYWTVGWGLPVTGKREPAAYIGVFATF